MKYAILSADGVCIGHSMLSGEVDVSNYVPITDWNEDYLWRKYENGVWSADKFEPPAPPVRQETNITDISQRLADVELALADLFAS